MKEKYIQIVGIVVAAVYGVFITFLYAAEPRSVEDITIKARTTIDSVTTKGQVIAGIYQVDPLKFAEGVRAFNEENYVAARDLLERADPEKRDARTQFYIAYSYYRQGWGRVSNDDALFKLGLDTLARVNTIDRDFRSDDPGLKLRTPAELRQELEEGLKVTVDDFNPLRLVRERK
jgi:hypothetical protein